MKRSEPERSGGPPARAIAAGAPPDGIMSAPDPEVPEKPVRRHFNASYKLQILDVHSTLRAVSRGGAGASSRRAHCPRP